MRRKALPSFICAAAMGLPVACAPTSSSAPESTPPPAMAEADCGAGLLSNYVGTPASEAAIAAIRDWRGGKSVRVLPPGAMATMDYRADRLNIDVDEAGNIKALRCG